MADREADTTDGSAEHLASVVTDESTLTKPGPSRRSSTSSSGSAKPLPPGHWTLPITGNCPRCHHYHKSVEIHIKSSSDSSHLADLDCENCHKLWLGSGSRNSTRVSLLSTATIDTPPMDTEFCTTLAHMVRSATRVAALSQPLPKIPEGKLPGPSRGPSIPAVVHPQPEGPVTDHIGNGLRAKSYVVPKTITTQPSTASRTRVVKPTTSNTNVAQSQTLLRWRQRIGGTFPRFSASRIGRLMKLHGDTRLGVLDDRKQSALDSMLKPAEPVLQSEILRALEKENFVPIAKATKPDESNIMAVPAHGSEDRDCLMFVDQEVINDMAPEQRHAFLRSQVTVSRTQNSYSPYLIPSLRPRSYTDNALSLLSNGPVRRNSALLGIGGLTNHWDVFNGSNPALYRRSLSESEVPSWEAATAVEIAPESYLHETLHRGSQLAVLPHLPSSQSTPIDWEEIRRDTGTVRSSLDSVRTVGARSAASARGRAFGHRSRRSLHSLHRKSIMNNAEASASQARLQTLRRDDIENQQGGQRPVSLPPPLPTPPQERRPSAPS